MTETAPTDKSSPVQKVMVGTDPSETADRAVRWAAALANRHGAELLLVQVMAPRESPGTERGMADATRGFLAERELAGYAQELAGRNGLARVVFDHDLAGALLRVAAENEVDTLVVGNVGMSQRKEFLLGNVPNRISHNARCNVIIVNTFSQGGHGEPSRMGEASAGARGVEAEPRLMGRATHIAAVLARHGIGRGRNGAGPTVTPCVDGAKNPLR